jgi:hypothetical protein
MCWPLSDGSSKFIPIDEQPNHQIVHAFHLGKAQRATNQPLDPGPEIDGLALDVRRVLLAYVMLRGSEMPRLGPPAVGVILRDAKGLSQLLQPQKDVVLPPPAHLRSHLPGLVINGVPEPSRMRFRLHKTPHFVELGAQSTTHLKLLRAPDFPLDLLGMHERQHPRMHWRQLGLFFFSVL